MQPETEKLLLYMKKSKGSGKVGLSHLTSLLADAEQIGHAAFVARVSTIFEEKRPKEASSIKFKDRLVGRLEELQLKTGCDRGTFIQHVVDEIKIRHSHIKKLTKSNYSFPKLINHYKALLGEGPLEAVAIEASDRYSRAH